MAAIKELIRPEADGSISFGDYEQASKQKKTDFPHGGDLYKVKTFREITKLERNGMFVYESVPGTSVYGLRQTGEEMSFTVEGYEDAQITVEMESDSEYEVFINDSTTGRVKTNLGGKLSFSVELDGASKTAVRITKC